MRLSAQRRRAGLLRGRVVAISLICFVVLWGIVFAQMATGNDPVLSAKEKASTATASVGSRRKGEATTSRELESETRTNSAPATEEEVVEEPEVEEEFIGPEDEFEEEEFTESEPEFEEEFVEAEPEPEFEEPLVTSQS